MQFIDNHNFQEKLKVKVKADQYSFIYDEKIDAVLDLGYTVKNMKIKKTVAIKFQMHVQNMPVLANFIKV